MAHFAKIDSNNKVETVIVAPDQAYVDSLGGRWIQTSYNTLAGVHYDPITGQPSADQSKALRKNYPSIGWKYDVSGDGFYDPNKPFSSWVLDSTTFFWVAPVAYPTITTYSDGTKEYGIDWDETNLRWTAVDKEDPQNSFNWDATNLNWVNV